MRVVIELDISVDPEPDVGVGVENPEDLARQMADYFQTVNPAFDRARFLAAVEEK